MFATPPPIVGLLMLLLLPVIALYLWDQRKQQLKRAARPPHIAPEAIIARVQEQEERGARVKGLGLGLTGLSALIAYWARNGPDALFIVAALGAIASFGFAAAYSGFAQRCPVCNSPIRHSSAIRLGEPNFPEKCSTCGARLRQ